MSARSDIQAKAIGDLLLYQNDVGDEQYEALNTIIEKMMQNHSDRWWVERRKNNAISRRRTAELWAREFGIEL